MGDHDRRWCTDLLGKLIKWPLTQPFRVPVDPMRDSAKTYFDVVKKPMDLGTIRKRHTAGQYDTLEEFIDDLHLVFDNAILFSGETSTFGYIATDIKKWINDQMADKPSSPEDEWQRRLSRVVARLHEHIAKAPPP